MQGHWEGGEEAGEQLEPRRAVQAEFGAEGYLGGGAGPEELAEG